MKSKLFSGVALLAALALSACPTTSSQKNPKKAAATNPLAVDESTSPDFLAFVGRLRKAVEAHDMNTIASMMVPNFAYVLGATPAQDQLGAGVFQYWDQKNVWPELNAVFAQRFVPKNEFMVAPPQFADPSAQYQGYRAGIRRVNGSWKFVYFVNG
ncbi:MAG TPA: hypothetical protein VGG02_03970 [Chthoniobacterales bacterium]|jgi:hypothetical protein